MNRFEAVSELDQAMQLRTLRNDCRRFMTRDTARVTAADQRKFFAAEIQTGAVRAWLLRSGGQTVAYLLLRPDGGRVWMSCGVAAWARGMGYGSAVARFSVIAVHFMDAGPAALEVWADNEPGRRVYVKAGYATVSWAERGGRVVETMEHA